MENNRNFILAVALSLAVVVLWQFLYLRPLEQARHRQAVEAQTQAQQTRVPDAKMPAGPAGSGAPPGQAQVPVMYPTREAAVAATPRVKIETPDLQGSVNLKGGRIDDVVLRKYTTTVDPASAKVVLFSPSGSPAPYYAEFGWLAATGTPVPNSDTLWKQENTGPLTPANPLELSHDNGAGLVFRRTISIDDHYMFTVADSVENASGEPVTLNAFGQVARLEEPKGSGYTVVHEGFIGSLGSGGLQEPTYAAALKNYDPATKSTAETMPGTGGFLGFTDQYWAAVVLPDPAEPYTARFFGNPEKHFYADYLMRPVTIAPKETKTVTSHLFAGAKEYSLLRKYEDEYHVDKFNYLIDWGWFQFITHPMFSLMDGLYKFLGNFGLAILLTTVLVKLAFFPIANRSFASMSKMKALQPEMKRIQERYKEDRAKQQQAMMELYKKEKVNPVSGCLPIFLQIPVFFSLYKVLLINVDMRHAPFFGWIRDLSAPDPTTIFNLFGLIPWTPPQILMLGVLPLLMGLSMWIQMRLTPTPPDPVQQKIFTYMPFVFTLMLAHYPAGLVLYWTWNNLLSFAQQSVIMKRQGTEIDILQNIGLKKLQQWVLARFRGDARSQQRKPAE